VISKLRIAEEKLVMKEQELGRIESKLQERIVQVKGELHE
jgi:hypothetical protein